MGQRNLPYLNKVKNSIFWNSIWDNYYNYSRGLNVNLFIIKFFEYLFLDNIFYSNYFLSKKNKNFLKKFYFFTFFCSKSFFLKNIPLYCSRLWFLKFKFWLLIIVYIYIGNRKFFKIKKIKNKFVKLFLNYKHKKLNNLKFLF